MDYSVILSEFFSADLDGIIAYLMKSAGPETAFRIGNELIDRALEIGESPFIGQPVKKRVGVRKVLLTGISKKLHYRSLTHKCHRLAG